MDLIDLVTKGLVLGLASLSLLLVARLLRFIDEAIEESQGASTRQTLRATIERSQAWRSLQESDDKTAPESDDGTGS